MHATTLNGIDIPVGLTIQPDLVTIHHDPELWGPVDPSTFYPPRWAFICIKPMLIILKIILNISTRFSKEYKRHPIAFLGFGVGPRNCNGQKFGLIIIKVVITKLLKKYEILPCAKTKSHLDFVESTIRMLADDVVVELKKKNSAN